ncbi:MAG: type II toxin-antitoxin system Phd/YefM family antitoxin [Gemmatimonadaceae bacterium]
MRAVGIKILKNRLSEYVRLAASGETILVTDRDRVVAQIGPPQESGKPSSSALLTEAVRKGWVTPAFTSAHGVPASAPVAPFADLLREHSADRDDR